MSRVALPGLTATSNSSNMSTLAERVKDKNPFNSIADWTDDYLKDIEINISDIRETTSDFTRKRNPGHRYWKGMVTFKYKGHTSRILKMAQCPVPYVKITNYGKDFVYASLQKSVCDAIVKSAMTKDIVVTGQDPKVSGSDNEWWATINNLDGRVGVVDSAGNFEAKDLKMIFDKSELGARINFDLIFSIRLTLENGADRKPHDVFRIIPDCSRGAIKAAKQEIEPPNIESQIPQQRAAKIDVADQELMDSLNALLI
ncbi:hypothetical protein LOZ61_006777 [Ophidiomyces ophidiicola]|nr:hypothetical protein LOZ61_006777 [Ophidiomyces ophidiicola]